MPILLKRNLERLNRRRGGIILDVGRLEKLCDACKGKYMRISKQKAGYVFTEFLYSPHLVMPKDGKIWLSTDSVITVTIHTPYTQNNFIYQHNIVEYRDGKMSRVEEGMRIYKTPYKGSTVKKFLKEHLNNRVKFY